jgi:hypothetical protein
MNVAKSMVRTRMSVRKLAENHFMKPDELIAYVEKRCVRFGVEFQNNEPTVLMAMGGLLLMAAKNDGLQRHPELYGHKLSECGQFYVKA